MRLGSGLDVQADAACVDPADEDRPMLGRGQPVDHLLPLQGGDIRG